MSFEELKVMGDEYFSGFCAGENMLPREDFEKQGKGKDFWNGYEAGLLQTFEDYPELF